MRLRRHFLWDAKGGHRLINNVSSQHCIFSCCGAAREIKIVTIEATEDAVFDLLLGESREWGCHVGLTGGRMLSREVAERGRLQKDGAAKHEPELLREAR